MAKKEFVLNIDERADVHPSVILEGNITIGKWTRVGPGTVIHGDATIGEHTRIADGVIIRAGRITIGNYVHIYDLVYLGGGTQPWTGKHEGQQQIIIEDGAWINHGAVLHCCRIGKNAVVGLNAALDYGCSLGEGAIVTNGSACRVGTVVPDNCLAEGVPAKVVRRDITDFDRDKLLGTGIPKKDVLSWGKRHEQLIREEKGL